MGILSSVPTTLQEDKHYEDEKQIFTLDIWKFVR